MIVREKCSGGWEFHQDKKHRGTLTYSRSLKEARKHYTPCCKLWRRGGGWLSTPFFGRKKKTKAESGGGVNDRAETGWYVRRAYQIKRAGPLGWGNRSEVRLDEQFLAEKTATAAREEDERPIEEGPLTGVSRGKGSRKEEGTPFSKVRKPCSCL